jgi:hypothetical protein
MANRYVLAVMPPDDDDGTDEPIEVYAADPPLTWRDANEAQALVRDMVQPTQAVLIVPLKPLPGAAK